MEIDDDYNSLCASVANSDESPKRIRYTLEFKLKAINFCKIENNISRYSTHISLIDRDDYDELDSFETNVNYIFENISITSSTQSQWSTSSQTPWSNINFLMLG
ncbi:unnamed protein product [Brachionus calyciflorus]|uniref:Uncharacterized protein n=1 Tax=Brachionus calyciflorus TaxID=104777 RepID=A0A814FXP1_9BILA|nr:unnamed protein product [Brachionus calyciflorus]